MTAWRVGLAMKPEQTFGQEGTGDWHYIGVGMDFNFTEQNGWRFQNGLGSKVPDLEFEGRFSGTWGGNLFLDYNNFYWLLFGLEGYAFIPDEDNGTTKRGIHVFTTSNSKSIKSFSLMIRKLDREVGGGSDETIILYGCTMNKVSPTYESNSSGVKVGIGGSYVDTKLTYANLEDTVGYASTTKNTVRNVEWGCLQTMNEAETAWEKIANNEKTNFTIGRTINTVPSCGERIDSGYYESGIQPIPIGATVYSRNPNQWQTRMHSGGIRNDLAVGGTSQPRRKGLEPMPNIRIASSTINDSETHADYVCYAQFEDVIVDSWGNSYNAGSEITESPSLKARKGRIIIKTPDVKEAVGTTTLTGATVTFNYGSGINSLTEYYAVGETFILPDPKKSGATFSGWSASYDSNTHPKGEIIALTSAMLTDGAVTFTANWT